jgi:hypothetical protein
VGRISAHLLATSKAATVSDHQTSGSVPTTDDFPIPVRTPKSASGTARRNIAALAAAAVTAAAVGAGAWAWHAWADQGAQPAEALPGNTLAYVAIDLDPPGGQKVEAFKTLRKFPSLKKQFGLGSVDEVRKSVVKQVSSDSGCDLDYATFEPWIGDRAAFALVAQDNPEPVVVVQVSDAAKARTALKQISTGCGHHSFGYVVGDEWAVLARSTAVATQVKSDADTAALAGDTDFKRLTEAAGDPGLATLYAAPEAGKALIDATKDDPFAAFTAMQLITSGFDPINSFVSGFGLFFITPDFESSAVASDSGTSADSPEMSPEFQAKNEKLMKRFEHFDELSDAEKQQLMHDQEKLYEELGPSTFADEGAIAPDEVTSDDDYGFPTPELSPALRKSLQNFTGLGGVARFEDGGLEVSVVGDSIEGTSTDLYAGSAGDDRLKGLPDDTAIAFGAGLSDGWVDAFIAQLRQQFTFSTQTEAETITSFEKATGLDLPGDLEALGGGGISVVVGSGFAPDTMFDHAEKAPIAVRIAGDRDKIEAALDKIRKKLDGSTQLVSRRLGDDVVVGTNVAYLDHLAKGGDDLTDTARFHQVVPDAKDATTVFFMNFDAGDWLAKAVASDGDRKDAEPLGALGMTVTKDGDQQKVLYRLSFDD